MSEAAKNETISSPVINIYQMFPRLYGNRKTTNKPGGTIAENGCGKMADITSAVLDRLHEYGFTHIWYTGIIEHATRTDYSAQGIRPDHPAVVKGQAGSPYAIKDYYDVDPDLAENVGERMKEFNALVKRTHKSGLKVVLDFVPNHVARQYHSDAKPARTKDLGECDDTTKSFSLQNNFYYIQQQPLNLCNISGAVSYAGQQLYKEYPAKATGNDCFHAYPGTNDWYETVKLNYGIDYLGGRSLHCAPIPDTWKKMVAILQFWARKGVDAFRCDMAEMVPVEFWEYAIPALKAKYPDLLFIAEVYNPAEYRNYLHRGKFDYLYDKVGLYDTLKGILQHHTSAAALTGCWQSIDDIRGNMLNFLENHDEQRIASDYFCGNAFRALPAVAVSALMTGAPYMVYAGQELGERGMDAEGFSGCDGRTTIFDYWGVESLQKLAAGAKDLTEKEQTLYDYYHRILRLRLDEPVIGRGDFYDLMYVNYDRSYGFNPDFQFAFLRHWKNEVVLAICNFLDEPVYTGVRIPQHAFDLFRLRPGIFSAVDMLTGHSQTIELKPDCHTMADVPAQGVALLKFCI